MNSLVVIKQETENNSQGEDWLYNTSYKQEKGFLVSHNLDLNRDKLLLKRLTQPQTSDKGEYDSAERR